MGTIAERYDRSAAAYERWWAPVLRPAALRVLDALPRDPRRILDVGAGTGTLALAAAARFPEARVTALDGSGAMLEVAAGRAADLAPADRARLSFVDGLADRIPAEDAAFDAVVSSFVLQLVPHRPRALAEHRRVLAPGGSISFVTWVGSGRDASFAPDEAFYDVLDDLGIPDDLEPEEARSGDYASADEAARQVRRAGFRDVTARAELLVHRYDPVTYVEFLAEYAETETFDLLAADQAEAVRRLTSERLARLDPDAFVWRAPIVYVRGVRPGG